MGTMTYAQGFSGTIPHSPAILDRALNQIEDRKRWYAVQTRSNFEKRSSGELSAKGIDVYLPALSEVHQWKDRAREIETPLFRGYLFVRLTDSLDARWQVLRSSGVVRILGRGAESEPVPDPEIEGIRKLLQTRIPFARHDYLREGVRVRVRHGALQGVEGILLRVRNQSRLVISVELLSQSVSTEIDADNAELIGRQ
jgi:transcription antitermination factor NusG